MGFQFTNNWPYSASIFPSMIDHTDPVNQAYFEGLHQEVDTIEDYLGLHPQGAYGTVRARLDAKDTQNTTDEGNLSTHTGNTSNPHQVSLEQARTKNNQISGAIDINKQELDNIVIDKGTSEPATPTAGQMFFRTDTKTLKVYDGTAWISLGGAGKMTAIWMTPGQAALPTSAFAELEKIQDVNRNYWIAKFDPDTDEGICFVFPVPTRTGSGSIRVTLYGRCNATSGTAKMYVNFYIRADNEDWEFSGIYDIGFAMDMTAKASAYSLIVNHDDDAFASFTEGKLCQISIRRDALQAGDTLAVDFELLAVKIEEV